jgi:hypothetical protein
MDIADDENGNDGYHVHRLREAVGVDGARHQALRAMPL